MANALLAQITNSGATHLASGINIPAAPQLALPAPLANNNNMKTDTSQVLNQSIHQSMLSAAPANPGWISTFDPQYVQELLRAGARVSYIGTGISLIKSIPPPSKNHESKRDS